MARNWDGDEVTSMAEACDHCAARANEPCVVGCECPACLERRGKLEAWAR